ncbi:hypothetical protein [Saccharothrix sp. ST-888]|uniref:hypothetical protein n=1 Tax=Saccharothrix sp. ST-888 TaxID=1427391 RepID=UPI000A4F7761|nr:hypothetical protein [Saccharothrix sp. ST-888]
MHYKQVDWEDAWIHADLYDWDETDVRENGSTAETRELALKLLDLRDSEVYEQDEEKLFKAIEFAAERWPDGFTPEQLGSMHNDPVPDDPELWIGAEAWTAAYETAEDHNWQPFHALLDGGHEAAMMANLYVHQEIDKDAAKLGAALWALGDAESNWTLPQLIKVVESCRGKTETDVDELVTQHINENWPGFPMEYTTSTEQFFKTHVLSENEVCLEGPKPGNLYYFDKTRW